MDRDYLDKLEREFREHDRKAHTHEHGGWPGQLDAALKRGREYHALALNTAMRQLISGMQKTLRLEMAYRVVTIRLPYLRRSR